jgi:hypothetical protein
MSKFSCPCSMFGYSHSQDSPLGLDRMRVEWSKFCGNRSLNWWGGKIAFVSKLGWSSRDIAHLQLHSPTIELCLSSQKYLWCGAKYFVCYVERLLGHYGLRNAGASPRQLPLSQPRRDVDIANGRSCGERFTNKVNRAFGKALGRRYLLH